MNIYCSKCGEPWGTDCLHDITGSYDKALKLFKVLGCGAFNEAYNDRENSTCDRDPIVLAVVLSMRHTMTVKIALVTGIQS